MLEMKTDEVTTEPLITTPAEKVDTTEKDQLVGHHLCEFCEAENGPKSSAESICECLEFARDVASFGVREKFDLILRIAESAILNKWAGSWNTPIALGANTTTITHSLLEGRIGGSYIVRVEFDGLIHYDLDESYVTEYGSAKIWGYNSDGQLRIKVNLNEDMENTESASDDEDINYRPEPDPTSNR